MLPGRKDRAALRSESAKLQEEALKMEAKLMAIKKQVREEASKTNAPPTGTRWGSSASDRGSIRSYHKDVRERIKVDRGAAKKVIKSRPRPMSAGRRLNPADSNMWKTEDVLAWLNTIGLEQYCETFRTNAVNGEVLLEMGTEDLDYMEIKALGHRKMILKGIEKLRNAAGVAAPEQSPAAHSSAPPAAFQSTASVGTETRAPMQEQGPSAKLVHWSQVKPLSENEVTGGEMPANLADGQYDEALQSRLFQQAVEEWRRGNSGPQERQTATSGTSTGAGTEELHAGEWRNPFDSGLKSSLLDEEDEASQEVAAGGGGKLLEGSVDEAEEHQKFMAAVEEWRRGGGQGTKVSCYKCFKVFIPQSDSQSLGDKHFCSAACKEAHEEREAQLKQHKEKLQEQMNVAEAEAKATSGVERLRLSPIEKEPLGSDVSISARDLQPSEWEGMEKMEGDAVKKLDNIWNMDIDY